MKTKISVKKALIQIVKQEGYDFITAAEMATNLIKEAKEYFKTHPKAKT